MDESQDDSPAGAANGLSTPGGPPFRDSDPGTRSRVIFGAVRPGEGPDLWPASHRPCDLYPPRESTHGRRRQAFAGTRSPILGDVATGSRSQWAAPWPRRSAMATVRGSLLAADETLFAELRSRPRPGSMSAAMLDGLGHPRPGPHRGISNGQTAMASWPGSPWQPDRLHPRCEDLQQRRVVP